MHRITIRMVLLAMASGGGLTPSAFAAVPVAAAPGPVRFERDFAPSEGFVTPHERENRKELCLNGLWQFQPMRPPAGWVRNRGTPPDLPPPAAGAWDAVPIRIP
jgi:beta-galactosidase